MHNIIVYFTADCQLGIAAYAGPCIISPSDDNKPIIGYVNVCPKVSFS